MVTKTLERKGSERMSTYTVTEEAGIFNVEHNGTPIKLKPIISMTNPLYAFGEHSDGSRNLSYAILLHLYGSGEAELLYQ